MDPYDEAEATLKEHALIRGQLANTWTAFFSKHGRLRPVQLLAIPRILAGRNILVTAPTAGGKTEAVVAPLCERLKHGRWGGMSLLVVTPTRALVNDLFHRLERPCQEARITMARKTSDHGLPEGGDEQLVITTPESLESLLTFSRERLTNLRALVIDEVHMLSGTARGDQLRFLLRRLTAYLRFKRGDEDASFQRVAMSATLPKPEETAEAFLGTGAEVVSISGQREIEATIIRADGDDASRARLAMEATQRFNTVEKVLVFVNSRAQVDLARHYQIGPFAHSPVFGHHGNLSRHNRENVEARFHADPKAVCVATTTLEVGIDIGDVDLVICMDPPFSLSSFLQRIGRGCRRLQGKTRVLCVARNHASELIFAALLDQARLTIPETPVPPIRRSVALQQVLAYLRQVEKHRRTLDQLERTLTLETKPQFTGDQVREVVQGIGDLIRVHESVVEPAGEGWAFIDSSRIYSNISSSGPQISLVDADTGKHVGTVSRVSENAGGVEVGGRSYELLRGSSRSRRKVRVMDSEQSPPMYAARFLPYSADVGFALMGRCGIDPSELAVLREQGHLVAFTWLGRLQNASLQGCIIQSTTRVKGTSFALHIEGIAAEQVVEIIASGLLRKTSDNPLLNATVERMVDVGPYFDLLDEDQKQQARGDWYDSAFLTAWVRRLRKVRIVTVNDPLSETLSCLGKL